jgi:hypothetical protein
MPDAWLTGEPAYFCDNIVTRWAVRLIKEQDAINPWGTRASPCHESARFAALRAK